jgi:hypothetical protein
MKNLLQSFQREHNAFTKGPLALLVQLTRIARDRKFPLVPDEFLTENKGQVAGLGGSNLKKILKEYGLTQILASEGGRTSRGNMGLMQKYIGFLNTAQSEEAIDFDDIEAFWVDQVKDYFKNRPFVLAADTSRTIAACLEELFTQVRKRQKENPGTQYLGAVLQHLTGAKLLTVLPEEKIQMHGAYVADAPTGRSGDFVIHNTVIHCTTAPGEPLLRKCAENIQVGCQPIIVTIYERVKTAMDLLSDAGLENRVEVWDIQQFLSTNIAERSLFDDAGRNAKMADIITKYNQIVDSCETDPGLRIVFEAK